eukprot:18851-Heterococcus_DN1.PRE.2
MLHYVHLRTLLALLLVLRHEINIIAAAAAAATAAPAVATAFAFAAITYSYSSQAGRPFCRSNKAFKVYQAIARLRAAA